MEKCLIDFCSPTLASIKSASLFNYRFASREELERDVSSWNSRLAVKGVELTPLSVENGRALIYVFRRSALERDLEREDVREFLKGYGYDSFDVDSAVAKLRRRTVLCGSFPHEIGVFLGYPLGDVIGFIESGGKNPKCVGCWKVYCDECAAMKTFERFKKCREIYERLWREGRSILRLTVAA